MENMKEQEAMVNKARCAITMRMGWIRLRQCTKASGWRSLSSSVRKACDNQAHSTHTTATAARLACQFMTSNKGGTMAPASMLPKGTPVCLSENTRDIWSLGVVRASRCELAGVIGP
jgi:hypothetical protein